MTTFTEDEKQLQRILDTQGAYEGAPPVPAARHVVLLHFDDDWMQLQLTRSKTTESCATILGTFARFYNRRHANKQNANELALETICGKLVDLDSIIATSIPNGSRLRVIPRPEAKPATKEMSTTIVAYTDLMPAPASYITSRAMYDQVLHTANADRKLAVICFCSMDAAPTAKIAMQFKDFAQRFAQEAVCVKVDVNRFNDLKERCRVTATPTFVFIRDGKAIDQFSGTNDVTLFVKMLKYTKRR